MLWVSLGCIFFEIVFPEISHDQDHIEESILRQQMKDNMEMVARVVDPYDEVDIIQFHGIL